MMRLFILGVLIGCKAPVAPLPPPAPATHAYALTVNAIDSNGNPVSSAPATAVVMVP